MFGKLFKITLAVFIVAEIISFIGYHVPFVNLTGFFVFTILAIVFSFYKFEYGLYILFAELFVGSKGYLFYFEHDKILFSIRMALFFVVFGVWVGNFFIKLFHSKKNGVDFWTHWKTKIWNSSFVKYWLILLFFVLLGIIQGFLNGNKFSDIFLDANAWFFLFLFLPLLDLVRDKEYRRNVLQVLFAAIALLSIKTLISLFIFSHLDWEGVGWVFDFYRWIRATGIGEVTSAGGGFYRVFFQSQIWVLIGSLILLSLNFRTPKKATTFLLYLLLSLSFATILTSFSRSFWVGGISGLFAIIGLFFVAKVETKKIITFLFKTAFVGLIGFFIVFSITTSFIGIIGERATKLGGEAAISSRWNLLSPLWEKVKDNWLLGAGYGSTITYRTQDPRILQSNPEGWYTTYAFEWGYLDIWLKLGIGGLLVYVTWIIKIFFNGFKKLKKTYLLNAGLLSGLVVLCVVNVFSPYLNHPLGIGYILLVSSLSDN